MNINSKFTLQRPPKPQSKTIKPVQNFSSVYQNHLNFQLDSNNIKLASRRPTSQENHRHGIKFIRKRAVDSDGNEPVNSTSVLISPKYSSAESGQVNNTVSLQPSAFKIRNISIQVKKSKQNFQPNTQNEKEEIYVQQKNYNSVKKQNKPKFFVQHQPLQLQNHKLLSHPLQNQLSTARSKTGSFMFNKPESNSQVCIVISECIFRQNVVNYQSLFQLKTICDRIFHSTHGTIVLKLYSRSKLQRLQSQLSNMNFHIHHLHFIIWNDEKHISSVNILALPKLQNIHNFVIISAEMDGMLDIYLPNPTQNRNSYSFLNNHSNVLQAAHKNKYLYLQMKDIEKLSQFISNFSVIKQKANQNNVNDQNNFHLSNKIIIHSENSQYVVKYDKNSQVNDITNQVFQSKQIIEKIKLVEKQLDFISKKVSQPVKQHLINLRTRSKQQISKSKQGNTKQFDQNFKIKLVQLAKILYNEGKQKQREKRKEEEQKLVPNFASLNMNNNYMNLKLPEVIGSIMGAQISANTAYQYVGELLRNNGFNYRQITQFAKNMSKN